MLRIVLRRGTEISVALPSSTENGGFEIIVERLSKDSIVQSIQLHTMNLAFGYPINERGHTIPATHVQDLLIMPRTHRLVQDLMLATRDGAMNQDQRLCGIIL